MVTGPLAEETGSKHPTPSPCGSASTTAARAADVVRQLLTMAAALLADDRQGERAQIGRPMKLRRSRAERVARLRDEMHVTANRVARFDVEEFPLVDPVQIERPAASSAALAPAQVLVRLELAAGRLGALLDRLPAGAWSRGCRMGARQVTLGELVDLVLCSAIEDLIDLQQAGRSWALPAELVSTPTKETSRHARAS